MEQNRTSCSSRRSSRSFVRSFVMRLYKRALRDTIILSATRYTTYDWHARSVATYVYTGTFYVLLFSSPSFLPTASPYRECSPVERVLRGHARIDQERSREKPKDKLSARFVNQEGKFRMFQISRLYWREMLKFNYKNFEFQMWLNMCIQF